MKEWKSLPPRIGYCDGIQSFFQEFLLSHASDRLREKFWIFDHL